jgi:hypothetical protein
MIYDDTFSDFKRAVLLADGARAYIDWPDWVKGFGFEVCSTWEIRQTPRTGTESPVVLYQAEDTTFLTDLTALADGSLLFLQWNLENCRFTENVRLSLIRLVPGEDTPTVITDQIDPGASVAPADLQFVVFRHGQKYSLSPDQRYVFWIGEAAGTSTISVTDLETNTTSALLAQPVTSMFDGFQSVFWVP